MYPKVGGTNCGKDGGFMFHVSCFMFHVSCFMCSVYSCCNNIRLSKYDIRPLTSLMPLRPLVSLNCVGVTEIYTPCFSVTEMHRCFRKNTPITIKLSYNYSYNYMLI